MESYLLLLITRRSRTTKRIAGREAWPDAMKPPNASGRRPLAGAFFCPQSRAPDEDYLSGLHAFLSHNNHGRRLLRGVSALHEDGIWDIFANANEEVRQLKPGGGYLNMLRDWAEGGTSGPLAAVMSGIVALPNLAVLQIGQYLRYLEHHGLSHEEFIAEVASTGGVQGYCGGLPAAIAIACAKDESEVVDLAATALRILVGIGAYAEAVDDTKGEGSTTLAVRLKHEGQGADLVKRFPRTYVSAITEPRSISLTGPADVLNDLYSYAKGQGIHIQQLDIRGKVHNPENINIALELTQLCQNTPGFQLPPPSKLQVTVRSNKTGESLHNVESLTEELITTVLASRCEWFTLMGNVAQDLVLSGNITHDLAIFGLSDCVPMTPFHRSRLQVTKVEVHPLVQRVTKRQRARYCNQEIYPRLPDDSIAIVGASCRLPGATNLNELWDILVKGKDVHRELPKERYDVTKSFRISQSAFAREKRFFGNFIDDISGFDHQFFGINAKEAANMDPQQRLLLELSHEALDDCGYLSTHVREHGDNVGCFIGASFIEYLDNTTAHQPTAYTAPGTIRAFLCGRLCYHYGWSGPAEVIDTACSASLVAINRACKAIQSGECNMALAGGINLITGINNFLDLGKASFLSATGQCKPFDEAADGYCRADGAGLVVLKSLRAALIEGDTVLGVIPAVATNQGGLSAGITVPQPSAQVALYQSLLNRSGFGPETITYVEAHGTGTQKGDPIEMSSIRTVLSASETSRQDTLYIGSIKGNVGHCETAAGVVGLLKILAMLKHGQVPAQGNHIRLNPKIAPLEPDNMAIAAKLTPWDVGFRVSMVSSYGAAGSNCALLCCEVPGSAPEPLNDINNAAPATPLAIPLLLSAASSGSLEKNAKTLTEYLQSRPDLSLQDVAFLLNDRRQRMKYLAAIPPCKTPSEAAKLLQTSTLDLFQVPTSPKPTILVFSGQISNRIALSRPLYDSFPTFRYHIDDCSQQLADLGFSPLIPAIFEKAPIESISTLQVGFFAVQYACAKTWMESGIQPSAVIGHSLGELSALCISGILSLRDTVKLIATRGKLIEAFWGQEKGGMLALNCTEREFRSWNLPDVEIACINADSSLVAVGAKAKIEAAEHFLRQEHKDIRFHRLSTSHGFHSSLLTPDILRGLERVSMELTWNESTIPLETCTKIRDGNFTSKGPKVYVSDHARQTVYFSAAVKRLEQDLGPCVWLEAGMDTPVINMVRKAVQDAAEHAFQGLRTTPEAPADGLGDVVHNLWKHGLFLAHWSFLRDPESGERPTQAVWLPPYQFDRQRHWVDNIDRVTEMKENMSPAGTAKATAPPSPFSPQLVTLRSNGISGTSEFTINVSTERFQKIVSGHAVRSRPLCPASMYMECVVMALQLLGAVEDSVSLIWDDIKFLNALTDVPDGEVSLRLETLGTKLWTFSIKTNKNAKVTLHCTGRVSFASNPMFDTLQRLVAGAVERVTTEPEADFLKTKRAYSLFSRVVDYSPFMQGIFSLTLLESEAVAVVTVPDDQPGRENSTTWGLCDAVILDTCIQVGGLLVNTNTEHIGKDEVAVMAGFEKAVISSTATAPRVAGRKVYAKFEFSADQQAVGDVFVLSEMGQILATFCGCRFTKISISRLEKVLDGYQSGTVSHLPSIPAPIPTQQPQVAVSSSCGPFTSSSDGSGFNTPPSTTPSTTVEPSSPGAEWEAVISLVSEFTGSDRTAIPTNAILAELGLDSLASIELAEQLSAVGVAISSSDLTTASLNDLRKQLPRCEAPTPSPKSLPSPSDFVMVDYPTSEQKLERSQSHLPHPSTQTHDEVLRILSQLSGTGTQDINPEIALVDIGIDSLGLIELQQELKDALPGVTFDNIYVDTTVQDLMKQLGISTATYSNTASYMPTQSPSNNSQFRLETLVYKEIDGVSIKADIYFPAQPPTTPMPVALMIHGGGHMTLSRKSVRPQQTLHHLANNILPVSIDYRLCPEVDLINGPMADVCSAYVWIRESLPKLAVERGISVDASKVVVVGWSTGGHLALSLGWTAPERGLPPPSAVLSFYAPYDFASGDLDTPRYDALPGRSMSLEKILQSLPTTPITEYDHAAKGDTTNLGWVKPGDPRSELVLALFKDRIGLPLLLNGLSKSRQGSNGVKELLAPPPRNVIESICPLSRVQKRDYSIPTFVIHGMRDEVVPYEAAEKFVAELKRKGVKCGMLKVDGARHIHDLDVTPGTEGWTRGVGPGYEFVFSVLNGI
ncbi:ketoacyl-synt-domain-containing protein [Podospora australis]|uniref:Ketoacyl-synt-domain-containing protein n=1 Tax=Podospora australis TaxID=1536484 RepID=A0AAN7AD48_9PEZI|nr:ketoacyl-synt-domain-containing protein [Podospora australis]